MVGGGGSDAGAREGREGGREGRKSVFDSTTLLEMLGFDP